MWKNEPLKIYNYESCSTKINCDSEAKRSKVRRSEAKQGEAKRGKAKRSKAKQSEAKQSDGMKINEIWICWDIYMIVEQPQRGCLAKLGAVID